MPEVHESSPGGTAHRPDRFDGATVRRILQRAAEEQHRLDKELGDSYSLQELEEMAAGARISPEALQAAVQADRRDECSVAARVPGSRASDERAQGWLGALERRMPRRWSSGVRSTVLAATGVMALSGLLLSLWVIAPAFFWVASLSLIAVSLLLLMGASPF